MPYNDSWCHQDANSVNEIFWDAQGVEPDACTVFMCFDRNS